ncbi:heparinase [Sphingobacteriaceae bacterium GW460-11-11-14-LB5]|nr:heparinase [Sphingobacteriaceae bacterium GW460-11-11-14-LB5]
MNIRKKISLCFLLTAGLFANAQDAPLTKQSFDNINLAYPGLEKVNKQFLLGQYDNAGKELLSYYRNKANKSEIIKNKTLNSGDKESADNALVHKFKPQKGYGFFDYGKDINWQFWPVKDNEVRWQLHRVKWWQSLGKAFNSTGDEKYAKEFIFEFGDWAKKNPLGLSKDNDSFAWRPLEVSERVNIFPAIFDLTVNAQSFTPAFLLEFLNSFSFQADYVPKNYSELGNHLLFEAQRVVGAGSQFPELKNAPAWRKSGITVLNKEIEKQVFNDGMQWEMSPSYHIASIGIFLNAYRAAQVSGQEKEFPSSYIAKIEKMVLATANFSFPDYTAPMFGDSWPGDKNGMMKNYADWGKNFPDNQSIAYFATDGKKGTAPDYLSKGLPNAGFYTFRNGWKSDATVMTLKAGPPGEFHAQPDNGTFELWVKGRNFTPDAGCYLYSGDAEIMKKRDWFRQTRVHSTLTLDNKNMVITKATQNKWEASKPMDVLTYTNPSYTGLNHQRSVLFINQKYFLIIDQAIGKATGTLGTHFQLKEDSKPVFDKAKNSVYTTYADGNNLLIQNLNSDQVSLSEEEGKVSYVYMKEISRPAFVFEKAKSDAKTQNFVSILYPFDGDKAPVITVKENEGNDFEKGNLNLTLSIDGKKSEVKVALMK